MIFLYSYLWKSGCIHRRSMEKKRGDYSFEYRLFCVFKCLFSDRYEVFVERFARQFPLFDKEIGFDSLVHALDHF